MIIHSALKNILNLVLLCAFVCNVYTQSIKRKTRQTTRLNHVQYLVASYIYTHTIATAAADAAAADDLTTKDAIPARQNATTSHATYVCCVCHAELLSIILATLY